MADEVTVGEVADYAESRRGEWVNVGGGFMVKWMATLQIEPPPDGVFDSRVPLRWKTVDSLDE